MCKTSTLRKFHTPQMHIYITRIQLLTTCVENILCFVFIVLGDYKTSLTPKISQITAHTMHTIIKSCTHTCMLWLLQHYQSDRRLFYTCYITLASKTIPNNKHYSQFVSDIEEEYAGACKQKNPCGMVSLAIPNKVHRRERERERERERNRNRENKSELRSR